MSTLSVPRPFVPLGLEALERQDVGARDLDPTLGNAQDPDAFPERDEMSERDADAAFVADMERRDGAPLGKCVACGVPVSLPMRDGWCDGQDVLCPTCEATGNALADDDDPDRPAGGAAIPPCTFTADAFASYDDDLLVKAVDVLDRGVVLNVTEAQRLELLDAATAELVARLDARTTRAALAA